MFSGSTKVVAFVPLDSRHPWRGAENDGGGAFPLNINNKMGRGEMTVGATGYIHWIPDTPGGVPRMTAGGGIPAKHQ